MIWCLRVSHYLNQNLWKEAILGHDTRANLCKDTLYVKFAVSWKYVLTGMCCLKCKAFLRILIFLFSETNSVSHFLEFDKFLLRKLFYGTSLGDEFWNKMRKSISIMSEEYFSQYARPIQRTLVKNLTDTITSLNVHCIN